MDFFKSKHDGQIRPLSPGDEVLFEHCGGSSLCGVTESEFDEKVEPLLFLHGVTMTNCDWRED